MKQIEITTRVNETLEEAIKKLEKHGFKKVRESKVKDIYLTQKKKDLNKKNIIEILSSCVLLRYLKINDEQVIKKIIYKNKVYDDNQVISEEKINLNCEDLNIAYKLFQALKFEKLTEVKYDVLVMKKNNLEFAFQNVNNLGLLLEYENLNDFEEKSNEEILEEKKIMIKELKSYGLNISNEIDVKKAYELVLKSLQI